MTFLVILMTVRQSHNHSCIHAQPSAPKSVDGAWEFLKMFLLKSESHVEVSHVMNIHGIRYPHDLFLQNLRSSNRILSWSACLFPASSMKHDENLIQRIPRVFSLFSSQQMDSHVNQDTIVLMIMTWFLCIFCSLNSYLIFYTPF